MLTKQSADAYAVLGLVAATLSDDEWLKVRVQPYLNGRECGFSVEWWWGKRKIVFANDRHSDQVVVYEGLATDFGMNNELRDKVYARKRILSHVDAAEIVVDQLRAFDRQD